jgi:hypothetical protein
MLNQDYKLSLLEEEELGEGDETETPSDPLAVEEDEEEKKPAEAEEGV